MSSPKPSSRKPVFTSTRDWASTPLTWPFLRTDASSVGLTIRIRSASSVTRKGDSGGDGARDGRPSSTTHSKFRPMRSSPPSGAEQFADLLGRTNRHDLELRQVPPLEDPLHQEPGVFALHELEAAVEGHLDPTVHIPQPLGQRPPRLAEPRVNGDGVAVLESLDDHEQHHCLLAADGSSDIGPLLLPKLASCPPICNCELSILPGPPANRKTERGRRSSRP